MPECGRDGVVENVGMGGFVTEMAKAVVEKGEME